MGARQSRPENSINTVELDLLRRDLKFATEELAKARQRINDLETILYQANCRD